MEIFYFLLSAKFDFKHQIVILANLWEDDNIRMLCSLMFKNQVDCKFDRSMSINCQLFNKFTRENVELTIINTSFVAKMLFSSTTISCIYKC
jgi:hypothetical protein